MVVVVVVCEGAAHDNVARLEMKHPHLHTPLSISKSINRDQIQVTLSASISRPIVSWSLHRVCSLDFSCEGLRRVSQYILVCCHHIWLVHWTVKSVGPPVLASFICVTDFSHPLKMTQIFTTSRSRLYEVIDEIYSA